MHWQKVTIVGVGLLGGSLGMALIRRKLARQVVGYVRRAASVKECVKLRAAHHATQDLKSAVAGADLVVLCTPLSQMQPLVKQMLPALKRGAIVTDVGSVKASVVKDVESLLTRAGVQFVAGHPMAGGEKMGVSAAQPDLFEGAVSILTPTRSTNTSALRKVETLWKAVGARPMRMSPALHDTLVSRTSHLPHVVAAALASNVLNPKHPAQQAALCAAGFRDTSRVASGSPGMWRDIAMANRRPLAATMKSYIAELETFRNLLTKADAKGIENFFAVAKQRRDHWCACGASPSPE